ncbi:MAG: Rieske 2Fe-2S domain-containing protein [Janthinobacterium lividum]
MLMSRETALRRYWYCLFPVAELGATPRAFRLLGEDIAVWADRDGVPHAVLDRCPHRTAKLSLGTVREDAIVCPYHGWAFAGDGHCVHVPQDVLNKPVPFGVKAFRCEARYGQVWVCLDEPVADIPEVPQFGQPGFRQVFEFSEEWACSALRIMENEFDAAHLSFVHAGSFGSTNPVPSIATIAEQPDGFIATNEMDVRNPEDMRGALHMVEDKTVRRTTGHYMLPFNRVTEIAYPNGLKNVLVTWLTPMEDNRTRFNQFVMRNDTEAQVPSADVIAFDRRVTLEDKVVLESTAPMVPLDVSEGVELHMPSDHPGLLMRRMLRESCALLRQRS